VELPKVVPSVPPFHKMAELAANPEPFTVRVNAAPPACALDGLRPLMVGVGGAIVNAEPFDNSPFALTVTVTVPGAAMRLEETVPVSWLAFPKVVDSGVPFQKIVELAENPEPFTVKVKVPPPACAVDGFRLLITGFTVAVATVNVELFDTRPLVFTATVTVPGAVMRLAPTEPVN